MFVESAAPPMNLVGPELVRDLVSVIQHAAIRICSARKSTCCVLHRPSPAEPGCCMRPDS